MAKTLNNLTGVDDTNIIWDYDKDSNKYTFTKKNGEDFTKEETEKIAGAMKKEFGVIDAKLEKPSTYIITTSDETNEDDETVDSAVMTAGMWDAATPEVRTAWLEKNGCDATLNDKQFNDLPDDVKAKFTAEVDTKLDAIGEGLISDAIKKSVAKNFGISPEGEVVHGSGKIQALPTLEKFMEGIVMDQAEGTNTNTSKIPSAGKVEDGDTKSVPKMYEAHDTWKKFDAVKKKAWLTEKKFNIDSVAKLDELAGTHFGKLPKEIMEGFINDMADKSAAKNFGIPVAGIVEKGGRKKADLPVMEGVKKGRIVENKGLTQLPSLGKFLGERKILEDSNKVKLKKYNAIANKDTQTISYDLPSNRDEEFDALVKIYNDKIVRKAGQKAIKFNQYAAFRTEMNKYGVLEAVAVKECEEGESYTHEDGHGNVYGVTCKTMDGDKGTFVIDEIIEKGTNPAKVGDTLTLDKAQMYDMEAANMAEGVSFADDDTKMADFNTLSKEEFLAKYTEVTDDDYETTKALVDNMAATGKTE